MKQKRPAPGGRSGRTDRKGSEGPRRSSGGEQSRGEEGRGSSGPKRTPFSSARPERGGSGGKKGGKRSYDKEFLPESAPRLSREEWKRLAKGETPASGRSPFRKKTEDEEKRTAPAKGGSGKRTSSKSSGRTGGSSREKSSDKRKSGGKKSGEIRRDGRTKPQEEPNEERRELRRGKGGKRESDLKKNEIRLNRLIAEAGIASRRAADEIITSGRVRVNGKVVTTLGTVVTGADLVTLDGDPVRRAIRFRYVLLNKPKDTITTMNDEHGRKTVVDLVRSRERLFPVGRLDRNTTGVLLLTNDGDLAHRMTHPSYEVERVYQVKLETPIDLRDADKLSKGIPIGEGEESSPCLVSVSASDPTDVTVTLTEGKNREVRRMFDSLGYRVKQLNRKSYAGLTTRGIKRGEWRELKRAEVRELRFMLKLDR